MSDSKYIDKKTITPSKFRGRGRGGFITQALFGDVCKVYFRDDWKETPYWLEENLLDDDKLVMRTHYLMAKDPTGYKTAMKFLGNYDHWEYLTSRCKWFQLALEKWNKQLFMEQKSKAIERIQEIAFDETDRQSLTASKYLAEAAYDKDTSDSKSGRGRPSNTEIKGELKKQVKVHEAELEDMKRIGLKLVK